MKTKTQRILEEANRLASEARKHELKTEWYFKAAARKLMDVTPEIKEDLNEHRPITTTKEN